MPVPKRNEREDDYVKRCVPYVLGEGSAKEPDQAVAMCHSMYSQNKKADEEGILLNHFDLVSLAKKELAEKGCSGGAPEKEKEKKKEPSGGGDLVEPWSSEESMFTPTAQGERAERTESLVSNEGDNQAALAGSYDEFGKTPIPKRTDLREIDDVKLTESLRPGRFWNQAGKPTPKKVEETPKEGLPDHLKPRRYGEMEDEIKVKQP